MSEELEQGIRPNDTTVSDAFYKTILGKPVEIQIQQRHTANYTILQVDKYNLIIKDEYENYLLVNKASVISITLPFEAVEPMVQNVNTALHKIAYKESKRRLDKAKDKLDGTPRHKTPFPSRNYERPQQNQPTIVVKQKRTYGNVVG